MRTRLLSRLEQDPNLSLHAIANECQRLLNLKHDTAMVQNESSVCTVRQQPKGNHSNQHNLPVLHYTMNKKLPSPCWYCGMRHYARFCQFKQHRCRKCNRVGHKDGFCQKQQPANKSAPSTNTSKLFVGSDKLKRSFSLTTTFKLDAHARRRFVQVQMNGHLVKLQLDTASDITIISRSTWNKIGQPKLEYTDHTAITACGGELQLSHRLVCPVTFNETTISGMCYVTERNLDLLGLDWIDDLGLADFPISKLNNIKEKEYTVNDILSRFAAVYEDGLRCCTQTEVKLRIKENVTPSFKNKRPVPYAAIPLVDAELERLKDLVVITPITYSKWAAPIVVVKKANGTVRICADFSTGLDSALEDNPYPLPVPNDLFTTLNGGKYFTKLDLSDAYLQVPVHE